jgi:Prokaryotic E2 family D
MEPVSTVAALIQRWFPGMAPEDLINLLGPCLEELEAVLCFHPGQYRLCYRDEDGHGHVRYLAPAAVRAAFANEISDSGWIAPHTVRCGDGATGPWVLSFFPAACVSLLLENGQPVLASLTIPFPPVLLAGNGPHYWVWACREAVFSPTMSLAAAPVPNVMETGAICWGNNTPPLASPQTMADAWALFFATPFNGHVVQHKSRRFPADVRQQLRALAERRPPCRRYPQQDLVPLPLTPEEIVRQLHRAALPRG